MKVFAVSLLLVASAAAAFASYEMVLIADSGRIHRYDPEANVYLGSFGRFASSVVDMATDQNTGKTFAVDGSGAVIRYSYSTGTQEAGVLASAVTTVNMVNNEVWTQAGTTVRRYDHNLVSLGTFSLAATNVVSSMHAFSGKLFTVETSGTTVFMRRYSTTGAFEVTLSTFLNVNSVLGKLGNVRVLVSGATDLLMVGVNLGGTNAIAYTYMSGSNGGASGTYNPGIISPVRDFAPTHIGGIFVGQNASNSAQGVFTVSGPYVSLDGPYGSAQLTNPAAVNTIVAPEPASLLAFGLGGLWLLRRKR